MTDARNAASGVETLGTVTAQALNAASGVETLGTVTAEARNAASGVEVLGVAGVSAVYVTDIATGARLKTWSSGLLYDIQITS